MNLRKLAAVAVLVVTTSVFGGNAEKKKAGNILDWGDSPQGYLMTVQERSEWETVHSEGEAATFIQNYWTRHGEAFHAELMNRIAAADKFLGLSQKKGSETERGRVFIVLGAPNRQKSDRNDNVAPTVSGTPGVGAEGAKNSIEQRAFMTATWIYKPDRLPKDLNVAELTVIFQILRHDRESGSHRALPQAGRRLLRGQLQGPGRLRAGSRDKSGRGRRTRPAR